MSTVPSQTNARADQRREHRQQQRSAVPHRCFQPNGIGTTVDGRGFDGSIDEVAVYDSVLSPTQVATHYAAGTS